jgi:predicted ribosome quality control (RQC) complex YloA/Tae2 family protein
MKTALTSVDVYFLARDLYEELDSSRIEKVYQISERELKIRIYSHKGGSNELIIAPNYVCITGYGRDVPEQPSSFAMQLRKHLKGSFIRSVKQHGFDRILEFEVEKKDAKYILIAELFSKGNVILCDSERRIRGLLEWQKWRDRKLGVGQIYEYPPASRNPLELNFQNFQDILGGSGKSLVATLATDLSWGGTYAEEICLNSKIDKNRAANDLDDDEIRILFTALGRLTGIIKRGVTEPSIILDEHGRYLDIIPFQLDIYEKFKGKKFGTLNEAIDNYFIESEFREGKKECEERIQEKLDRIRKIALEQEKTVAELEKKSDEYKKIGDLIYQNFQALDQISKGIGEERIMGADWSEIGKKFIDEKSKGLKVCSIERGGSITVEVESNR